MNERWTGQTLAAVLGLHLLAAVVVAAVLVFLAAHWHRVRIRRAQVAAVRVALAGWLTQPPVSPPLGGGMSTAGAGSPDAAPAVVDERTRPAVNGRHRLAA